MIIHPSLQKQYTETSVGPGVRGSAGKRSDKRLFAKSASCSWLWLSAGIHVFP